MATGHQTIAEAIANLGDITIYTAEQIGSILYPQTSAETSAGVTPTNYQYDGNSLVNVLRYGPDRTGASDAHTAFTNAMSALPSTGGIILAPPGTYKLNTALNFTKDNVLILAHGAKFTSAGAVVMMDMSAVYNAGIRGATFDARGNSTVLGFVSINALSENCYVEECHLLADASVSGSFIGVNVQRAYFSRISHNRFNSTGGTGNFGGIALKLGTASTANADANATDAMHNSFGSCDKALVVGNANASYSAFNKFELCVDGITLQEDTENYAAGFVSAFDRFESNTKAYRIDRSTTSSSVVPPHIHVPFFTGNTTNISNPNSIPLTSWINRGEAMITGNTDSYAVNNPRGSVTIVDANTSASVSFSPNEPDANYYLTLSVGTASGSPAAGAYTARWSSKATTGFTITLEAAPGAGTSVTIDWVLRR